MFRTTVLLLTLAGSTAPVLAADGNRLTYLDESCDPYYPGLGTARLITPQWIGQPGVEAAIVLSVDDLFDVKLYEEFLRPILERLKKIDGRAPLSLMAKNVEPQAPLLQKWLNEGVSLEAHTYDHPCPCLQLNNFARGRDTYDRGVDHVQTIPNSHAVAFRMPCCDSMNSSNPRFYTEIFNRVTPEGNWLGLDASVFQVFTADDPALPKSITLDADGKPRFWPYAPDDRKFVNLIENYPYPYVISRLCWEMPNATPDDWQGFFRNGASSPKTLADMRLAIDAAVLKQGVFVLTFHPHKWIRNQEVVELIDYAVAKHGRKIQFLNFRDVYERLTADMLGGQPLRAADGGDNGVRLLDLNADGYMDVVVGNAAVRQTRLWDPSQKTWRWGPFPTALITTTKDRRRQDAQARFGVLQKNGFASVLVRNEKTSGVWHFDGQAWQADPQGLAGFDLHGPVQTGVAGRDQGVRLRDLDGDGVDELVVGSPRGSAAFAWSTAEQKWRPLPFGLPKNASIADQQGRDAGLRFVDINEDGRADVVFSNAERYGVWLFTSPSEGWSRQTIGGTRGDGRELPMIVRADGTNNGAWFKYRRMWVQNEETGHPLKKNAAGRDLWQTDDRPYAEMLAAPSR